MNQLWRNRRALVGLGIIIVFISIGTVEAVFYQMHWHVRASDEGREGLASFLNKRPAGWLPTV
mgnify:CR=1 FL=1